MSAGKRRLPMIAVGLAVAAVVLALVAVAVVAGRGDGVRAASAAVVDQRVAATDVVKLQRDQVEVVVEGGRSRGLRIKDAALAKLLGLQPADVITAISGRPMTRELDVYEAMFNTGMMGATTLYVELERDHVPTLVRWRLDGDLRAARHAALGSSPRDNSLLMPAPPLPPDPVDPLMDTIERLDDFHAQIPRATVDKMLADPMAAMKSARVVPAMKNGQPDGFKVYAIRPSSLWARLGFMNGDTIRAINGYELTSPDKALEVYTKVKSASSLSIDLERRGKPQILTITVK